MNAMQPAVCKEKLPPKIIWSVWFQGVSSAPMVPKACFDSWHSQNPEWDMRILDTPGILRLMPDLAPLLRRTDMTWTGKSNLVRLNLLDRFGGVWVDATCYCTLPLEAWLPKHMDAGFFAFQRTDRLMLSTWFLAAYPGNRMVRTWLEKLNGYWSSTFTRSQESGPGRVTCGSTPFADRLEALRIRHNLPTSLWFSYPVRKLLKIYPYSSTHYMFERIYRRDAGFRADWDSVPKLHADIPHELQHHGLFRADFDEAWFTRITRTSPHPLHKLTWKYAGTEAPEGCLLYRLIRSGAAPEPPDIPGTRPASFCFCTMAFHAPYRKRAQRLCADVKTMPWVVLTDEPADFEHLSVRAVRHQATGPMAADFLARMSPTGEGRGGPAYHDKRFAILAALEQADTALYMDADSRINAMPIFGAFPPGIAVLPVVRRSIAEHLEVCGSWRMPFFVALAEHLTGSADILHTAQWCHEAFMAITKDGRESRFFEAWSIGADFLQSRGAYSGEGGVIGLAAAYAGWTVDYDALPPLAASVLHESGGPKKT